MEPKEFIQRTTELIPHIRKLLQEIAFLIFQLASWAALITIVSGKLV